jgi:ribosomal protein S17
MAVIEKKAWPELYEAISNGKKKFDLRLNDEECKEGDILFLREYDPLKKEYTGRKIKKKITYLMKTKDLKFWKPEETDKYGFVVMSLE